MYREEASGLNQGNPLTYAGIDNIIKNSFSGKSSCRSMQKKETAVLIRTGYLLTGAGKGYRRHGGKIE